MIEDAARILFEAGLNVSNYIYDGDPKQVLVHAANEWKAHTIVLGSRGLHHGNRLSLGTLASAVAARAHCSVEIIRPARFEKPAMTNARREAAVP
jgi:nucleotide-binding universal stress UspA family protein